MCALISAACRSASALDCITGEQSREVEIYTVSSAMRPAAAITDSTTYNCALCKLTHYETDVCTSNNIVYLHPEREAVFETTRR
jgi:hypothetical protein